MEFYCHCGTQLRPAAALTVSPSVQLTWVINRHLTGWRSWPQALQNTLKTWPYSISYHIRGHKNPGRHKFCMTTERKLQECTPWLAEDWFCIFEVGLCSKDGKELSSYGQQLKKLYLFWTWACFDWATKTAVENVGKREGLFSSNISALSWIGTAE